jgi:DNA-binding transcriptional MerR regulator
MDKTYNTSQVSGMTGIHVRTMQDYVQSFRENFSEAARQPSKGRRFTDADIKTLLTIKRARSQRISDEDIKKIFSGEIVLPLAQEYNDDDIKQIALNAIESFKRAELLTENCEAMIVNMQKSSSTLWNKVRQLETEVNTLKSRADHFREWQIFMMKEYPKFNPYADTKDPAQEPATQAVKLEKRTGFFEALKDTWNSS